MHKDENAEPSEYSLGGKNGFKIKNNLIYDSNNKEMSHYFKMDYKWIKKWIDMCVSAYENYIKSSKIKKEFKKDTQNVISSLNQYKTLLTWYIATDDYKSRDYVMDFIFKNKIKSQNLKNIMKLYKYTKNKAELKDLNSDDYKKAKEIIKTKWSEICEELIHEFIDKLEYKIKKEQLKIGKNILSVEKVYEKVNSTRNFFIVYPKKYDEKYIFPSFNLYFKNKNYRNLCVNFCITYYYDNNEEYLKYEEKIHKFDKQLKLLNKDNKIDISKASIYKEIVLDEKVKNEDFEFIYYIINYDEIAKTSKIKTIEDYIYNEIKNFIDKDGNKVKKAFEHADNILTLQDDS